MKVRLCSGQVLPGTEGRMEPEQNTRWGGQATSKLKEE